MKTRNKAALFVLLALLGFAGAPAWSLPALTGRVVSVHDGDTLTLLTAQRSQVKVRLYGIDAPELDQAFGSQAKAALSEMVFGQAVTVYETGRDRYGRVLGWVFAGKRRVNLELVSRGFAWWYTDYARREVALQDAEMAARQEKRGLWADAANALPPWDWRKGEQARRAQRAGQGGSRRRVSSIRPRMARPRMAQPRMAQPAAQPRRAPRPVFNAPQGGMAQGGAGRVWVNTPTGVYHYPGTRYYGKTAQGVYMTEGEARARGFRPAR